MLPEYLIILLSSIILNSLNSLISAITKMSSAHYHLPIALIFWLFWSQVGSWALTLDLRIKPEMISCLCSVSSWSKCQQKFSYAKSIKISVITSSIYICGKIQSCIHEMIQVPCFTHEVTTYWRDESYSDCKESCPRVWVLWASRFQSNSVGLAWVGWRWSQANAGNKSVSLTRCLSSSDIPQCPHQLPTNKDVWEANRGDQSRCQGEKHLVSGELLYVRSEKSIRNRWGYAFPNLHMLKSKKACALKLHWRHIFK